MKKYEKIEVTICYFAQDDVITASNGFMGDEQEFGSGLNQPSGGLGM